MTRLANLERRINVTSRFEMVAKSGNNRFIGRVIPSGRWVAKCLGGFGALHRFAANTPYADMNLKGNTEGR